MQIKSSFLVSALVLVSYAYESIAQENLIGEQAPIGYSKGIGRIIWTVPNNLHVILAVPHFSAGPRLKCDSIQYECEIEVAPRDVSISDEKRILELEKKVKAYAEEASNSPFRPTFAGADRNLVYTTLRDPRPNESYRYLTIGYALKGPGIVRFHALTKSEKEVRPILMLIDTASAIDAKEMWALRLKDYKIVCEEQFQSYTLANEKALLASPFSKVDLVAFFKKQDSSMAASEIEGLLESATNQYREHFGGQSQERKRSFCESLPKYIARVTAEVSRK